MISQLIIVLVITNLGLFFILRVIFNKQLDVAIKRLQKLHQENLDREAKLKKEYEVAQEEHRQEVERGRQEATRIKEIAKESMNRLKDETLAKSKERAEAMLVAAKKEAEEYQNQAKQDLEKKAVKLSLELVKSTFSSEAMEPLQDQFIAEIIAVIEEMDDPRLKMQNGEVKFAAAVELSDKQKTALLNCLNHKTGRQLKLEITKEEGLVAGLIINFGELVLDASLQNRMKRALERL